MTESAYARIAERLLVRSPVQAASVLLSTRRIAVLAYHGIRDAERFRRQMTYLVRRTTPLTVEDFVRIVRERRRPDRRHVLVTFDDGDRSVVEIAKPILEELGVPALAFPVAGVLDTDTPYWWDEAEKLVSALGVLPGAGPMDGPTAVRRMKQLPNGTRLRVLDELRKAAGAPTIRRRQLASDDLIALERAGIAIGNHTDTHPCLPRCDPVEVAEEIGAAHRRLTKILGHAPTAFCYPNGDRDERAEDLLSSLGYEASFLFDHRLCDPTRTDLRRIPRVRVDADADLDRFTLLLSGAHSTIHHLRGRA